MRKRILFVCTGNTCRSPMAAALAADLAARAGLDWEVSSAGLAAAPGMPLSRPAESLLSARGVPAPAHEARRADGALVAAADAVYAMTREHASALTRAWPEHAAKVAVLREAAGLRPADVEDPVGGDDAAYARAADAIAEALKILVEKERHAHL